MKFKLFIFLFLILLPSILADTHIIPIYITVTSSDITITNDGTPTIFPNINGTAYTYYIFENETPEIVYIPTYNSTLNLSCGNITLICPSQPFIIMNITYNVTPNVTVNMTSCINSTVIYNTSYDCPFDYSSATCPACPSCPDVSCPNVQCKDVDMTTVNTKLDALLLKSEDSIPSNYTLQTTVTNTNDFFNKYGFLISVAIIIGIIFTYFNRDKVRDFLKQKQQPPPPQHIVEIEDEMRDSLT